MSIIMEIMILNTANMEKKSNSKQFVVFCILSLFQSPKTPLVYLGLGYWQKIFYIMIYTVYTMSYTISKNQ